MFTRYYFFDGEKLIEKHLKEFPIDVENLFKTYGGVPLIVLEGANSDLVKSYVVFEVKKDGSVSVIEGVYEGFRGDYAYLNEKAFNILFNLAVRSR
jgi:transcription antitermination factor NusG